VNDSTMIQDPDPELEKRKRDSIKALERKIDELPLLPTVVTRLMSMDRNADDFFDQVKLLASEDPPFAARLIHVANSAYYAHSKPITNIHSAVTLLGGKAVAGMITSMAVMRVFVPTREGQKKLWSHSIEVAVSARIIAHSVPAYRPLAEMAYLVGLLHDIGRFIMFEHDAEDLIKVNETHWGSLDALVQAELDVFRFTHSELGFLACKKWHFPNQIAQVIRHHHDQFEIGRSGLDKMVEQLVVIIQLSDLLSVSLLQHPEFEDMDVKRRLETITHKVIKPGWAKLPVTAEFLERNCERIWQESHQLANDLEVA